MYELRCLFLGTIMVSEANVDSNKTKNENTETEIAIDEMTVVKFYTTHQSFH